MADEVTYSERERGLIVKCAGIAGVDPDWMLHMLDCGTCVYESGCGCCSQMHECETWYKHTHDGQTREEVEERRRRQYEKREAEMRARFEKAIEKRHKILGW